MTICRILVARDFSGTIAAMPIVAGEEEEVLGELSGSLDGPVADWYIVETELPALRQRKVEGRVVRSTPRE